MCGKVEQRLVSSLDKIIWDISVDRSFINYVREGHSSLEIPFCP